MGIHRRCQVCRKLVETCFDQGPVGNITCGECATTKENGAGALTESLEIKRLHERMILLLVDNTELASSGYIISVVGSHIGESNAREALNRLLESQQVNQDDRLTTTDW